MTLSDYDRAILRRLRQGEASPRRLRLNLMGYAPATEERAALDRALRRLSRWRYKNASMEKERLVAFNRAMRCWQLTEAGRAASEEGE